MYSTLTSLSSPAISDFLCLNYYFFNYIFLLFICVIVQACQFLYLNTVIQLYPLFPLSISFSSFSLLFSFSIHFFFFYCVCVCGPVCPFAFLFLLLSSYCSSSLTRRFMVINRRVRRSLKSRQFSALVIGDP